MQYLVTAEAIQDVALLLLVVLTEGFIFIIVEHDKMSSPCWVY